MRRPHAICYFAVFFAMLSLAQAQQPQLTLDQMEAIYQRELSTRHIPLLTRHLLEVQRLAATATDKAPYEKEINSLQQLLKTGVIDLRTAKAGGETLAPMPMPAPALPRIAGEAVITLFPALAENATSTSTTSNIGQIEWRLDHIDAGQYDLHLEYAAPAAVLAQPMPLVLELGTEKIETTLPPERATADDHSFRIMRLGRISLTAPLRGSRLTFTAGLKSAPNLVLRHLFITPAKTATPAP